MDKDTLAGLKNLFGSYNSSSSWKDTIKGKIPYFLPYSFVFIILLWLLSMILLTAQWEEYASPITSLMAILLVFLIALYRFFVHVYLLNIKYKLKTNTIICFKIVGFINAIITLLVVWSLNISIIWAYLSPMKMEALWYFFMGLFEFGILLLIPTLIQMLLWIIVLIQILKFKKALKIQSIQQSNKTN